MSFAIKNALLKLPAKRVLESGYFGIKAALLILKPALLILKCSLNPDTAKLSNNNSKKPRLHVRLVTGRTWFLMTPLLFSYNSLLKQRIF
jgi:hypothetical protein